MLKVPHTKHILKNQMYKYKNKINTVVHIIDITVSHARKMQLVDLKYDYIILPFILVFIDLDVSRYILYINTSKFEITNMKGRE
jgi:hypothetical protein